jgi:predicted O-linked N-acetylglucosamine transferase (SPINDLY family)
MTEINQTEENTTNDTDDVFTIKKCRKIPSEEMTLINAAVKKAENAKDQAQKAIDIAERAELELKNTIQRVFLAHMILPNCTVDKDTGVVTWPVGD